MRSKEVENSIKELTEITDLVKEEIKNNDENTTAILDITDLKNLDTLLNYTSEKEKENADAKEYADDVWRKQEELRAENEKLQNELIEEKQFNVKCLKLRDEEYIKKSVIRDKIKYYEDEIEYASPCGGWEMEYKYAIEVLKEILGE